ncbi:MAG: shikimate kinase [Candidatus Acidiferrales bacterium]
MKIEQRSRRLVCLTGFMGSGKSTTARQLASQLGWMNVDLDRRITDAADQSIPEIFTKKGESEFRRLEHEQLERLIAETREDQKPRVVSLGGGTVAQTQNLALMRDSGAILIWLDCPIEELLVRCAQITDRPLFRDEASFRKLYQERLPFYQMADYRVDSNVPGVQLVEKILALEIFGKVTA